MYTHTPLQGLTVQDVGTHIRVLQRKIANVKEQIKALQVGRVDLTLPSRLRGEEGWWVKEWIDRNSYIVTCFNNCIPNLDISF